MNNLVGKTFGRWTVLRFFPKGAGMRGAYWLCRCDCGIERQVKYYALIHGTSKGCGCERKEKMKAANIKHGAIGTPEYECWKNMKSRCSGKRAGDNPNYADRGIMVCERWAESFANFLADMGNRPSVDHTIERKDNDKGYEPGNCVWATYAQQNRNKRDNVLLTHNGKTQCLTDWAKELGMAFTALRDRINKGLSVDQVLSPAKTTWKTRRASCA